MDLLLAGAGMLACMALMMVVIPLGRKAIGWARGPEPNDEADQSSIPPQRSSGER